MQAHRIMNSGSAPPTRRKTLTKRPSKIEAQKEDKEEREQAQSRASASASAATTASLSSTSSLLHLINRFQQNHYYPSSISDRIGLPPFIKLPTPKLPSVDMEVEVKLRLPDADSYNRLKDLLSPFHIKTLNQQNHFFDTASGALSSQRAVLRLRFHDSRCIISLKANPVLIDGVSRVEEDEEEIEESIGRSCVVEPLGLNKIESRILRRCKEELGIVEGEAFVCLGGFGNLREVYDWRGLKVEVDQTKYVFGTCYEVEIESEDPEGVKKILEGFLNDNGIQYSYSQMSKFAVFRSGKLP